MTSTRWPNLFIAGAAKAGTGYLYTHLGAHPDIRMSGLKEPHFFSQVELWPEVRPFVTTVTDEGAYLKLFEGAGERYAGEASTSYFWQPATADRIQERCPDARVIISLRDPVERAYSHYLNDHRAGVEPRSFLDAVSASDLSPEGEPQWGHPNNRVALGFYAGGSADTSTSSEIASWSSSSKS